MGWELGWGVFLCLPQVNLTTWSFTIAMSTYLFSPWISSASYTKSTSAGNHWMTCSFLHLLKSTFMIMFIYSDVLLKEVPLSVVFSPPPPFFLFQTSTSRNLCWFYHLQGFLSLPAKAKHSWKQQKTVVPRNSGFFTDLQR